MKFKVVQVHISMSKSNDVLCYILEKGKQEELREDIAIGEVYLYF